jgi:hypothetical protein
MKRIVAAALLSAGLAACATEPFPPAPPGPPPGPPAFRAADFAWSTGRGTASIEGQVDYAPGRARYGCAGQPVILTPDTPFSRWRIEQLYGSTDRAAVPVAVVRGRQAGKPSGDYSSYVRRATCDSHNHFRFDDLPPGGWFIIVAVQPAAAGAEAVALMRRVQTRPGSVRDVSVG